MTQTTSVACDQAASQLARHLREYKLPQQIPLLDQFVSVGLIQPVKVAATQVKGNICASNKLLKENERLLKENAELLKENAALRSCMHHSGHFDKEGTEGLILRRGEPVSKMPVRPDRRKLAAATILEMTIMVQGPTVSDNIVELVRMGVDHDSKLLQKLSAENLLSRKKEKIPDKRTDTGFRMQGAKVASRRNAWLWQATTTTKNTAVVSQRKFMGKQVVDHPSKLQAYAEVQPEMPPIEFLVPDHPIKMWQLQCMCRLLPC